MSRSAPAGPQRGDRRGHTRPPKRPRATEARPPERSAGTLPAGSVAPQPRAAWREGPESSFRASAGLIMGSIFM